MERILFILFLLSCFVWAEEKPVFSGPEGKKAFDDLGNYYQDQKKVPPYQKSLQNLNSKDGNLSEQAGNYFHALFAQLFEDESNGRAKWQSLPYWGGGSKSVARDFRKTLAQYFGEKANSKSAIPAVEWLLKHEKSPINQEQAVKVLARVQGRESTELLKTIISNSHSNFKVLNSSITELTKRIPDNLKEILLKTVSHYRDDIRKNTRDSLVELGVKVEPFNIENAFTPGLIKNIESISEVMLPIPAKSTFGKFLYKTGVSYGDGNGNMEEETNTVYGWKFKEGNSVKILDEYGRYLSPKSIVKEDFIKLSGAVDALLTLRSNSDGLNSLSRQGGLTGQFQPRFLSEPEIRVSIWCWRKGLKKDTARLLFPRMNSMGDERWLSWVSRDLFGHPKHQEMLEYFTHERDYDKALAIASTLATPFFEEYQYHERAVELKKQLLARKEIDFKTLTLPTDEQWKKLKATMSRQSQIKFLADRLRLLNCFQMSQPGGVNYLDPQSADPGVSNGYEEKNIVINPYKKLMSLKLPVAELPYLVPYIADENYMLTFSYWRDFHPSRTFHRVNWAVAKVIDDAAKMNLSDLGSYYEQNSEGKRKHIGKIIQWCQDNKHLSRKDLVLKTLKETDDWRDFSKNASEAIEEKYSGILPLLINAYSRFPKAHEDIMEYICKLNDKNAVPFAKEKMSSDNKDVNFWAALVLISHSKGEEFSQGLKTISNILAKDDGDYWYPRAVIPLLQSSSKDAKKLACEILNKKSFNLDFGGKTIIHHLLLAKRKEAFDFLLEGLKSETEGRYQKSIKGDEFVEIIPELTKTEFDFDEDWPIERKTKARAEIIKWLTVQFQNLSEDKAHEFIKTPRTMYHAKWMLDAP